MPLVIANRQLVGDFGDVRPGETFWLEDDDAEVMERRGLVTTARPAARTYQTKVITPEVREVKPAGAIPFRDVSDLDPEPPALAAVRAAVCGVPDVSEQGNISPVERRTRRGPAAQ